MRAVNPSLISFNLTEKQASTLVHLAIGYQKGLNDLYTSIETEIKRSNYNEPLADHPDLTAIRSKECEIKQVIEALLKAFPNALVIIES